MIIDINVLPAHIAKQVLECQEPIYFAKEGQIINAIATPLPNDDDGEFNFDLDEMKKMVESPRIEVPKSALTNIEDFDNWLASVAL